MLRSSMRRSSPEDLRIAGKRVKLTNKIMPDQAQKTPAHGARPQRRRRRPRLLPRSRNPTSEELLKRMRKVDPDQAKRYRQRTGQ